MKVSYKELSAAVVGKVKSLSATGEFGSLEIEQCGLGVQNKHPFRFVFIGQSGPCMIIPGRYRDYMGIYYPTAGQAAARAGLMGMPLEYHSILGNPRKKESASMVEILNNRMVAATYRGIT